MKIKIKTLFIILLLNIPGISWAEPTLTQKVFKGYELAQDWDLVSAEKLSQSLLKEHPDSGDAHFLSARIEFLKGNYEHSWKILKKVGENFKEVSDFKKLVNATRKASKNFVSIETEHFRIRYEEGPDEVLIHYAREVLEKSYHVLGKILEYFPKEKVLIEIYPDREPFSKISPLTLKDILTSGTVALCKYHRIMMISPGSLVRGYNWMDTLSHEYVHYLLTKKSRNRLPLWMHEGVAKLLETRWRNEMDYMSPIMETILSGALKNDYRVPLENMMPSLAKLKTAEDVQLAYAEVSTMMEYLMETRGEETFPLLLEDLAEGKEFEESFTERAGADIPKFQTNWETWAKMKELDHIPGIAPLTKEFKNKNPLEPEKDFKGLSSQRAQDWTFLGDILKSRQHYSAAILEYLKAKEESTLHSPILFNKLAGTYIQTRKYEDAELVLKESLEYYSDFHTTLANLGELYFVSERYDEAVIYFEKAARINPFNPFIHVRLIELYRRMELPEKKKLQTQLFSFIN
ncbi:MAG: tetratricopeptide repeat protein [Nitrospinae bacterium]|nr:tetratricopeptide repeat protein [Nitrospinota bacterium]MZH04405.1 tetratricopeptide repeat protein [Nitrospinota bacterium]